MKAGDTVRWRSDFKPNGQPMLVHSLPDPGYVRLDGPQGSVVSEKLLELVESAPARCPACHGNGVDGSHQPCDQCGGLGKAEETGFASVLRAALEDEATPMQANEAVQILGERDGLLAVIDAQLAEIDRLAQDLQQARDEAENEREASAQFEKDIELLESRRAGEDEGFRESTERMLGNLCIALGFDRRPLVKTGIHELDALVRYVME